MKKFTMIFAIASMALAACTPMDGGSPGTNIVDQVVDLDATAIDEKAMLGAEILYNVPAHAYVTSDANGLISPELKLKLKPMLGDMYSGLLLARCAYRFSHDGNLPDDCPIEAKTKDAFNSAVDTLNRLSPVVSAMIPFNAN